MSINDEITNRKIIDLYFNQHKTIREVCKILVKSSRYAVPIIMEHRLRLADNNKQEKAKSLPEVRAYKLFAEGKSRVEESCNFVKKAPIEATYEILSPGQKLEKQIAEVDKKLTEIFNRLEECANRINSDDNRGGLKLCTKKGMIYQNQKKTPPLFPLLFPLVLATYSLVKKSKWTMSY